MNQNQHQSIHSTYSPSFNCYATNGLADVAARVTADLASSTTTKLHTCNSDDFEFDLTCNSSADCTISSVYPVFDRDLLHDFESDEAKIELRKLFFFEDHEHRPSTSQSDDLMTLSPDSYCMWTPKTPSQCRKNNSTGSTATGQASPGRAWRLRNMLRRSKSEGKEGLMLVAQKEKQRKDRKAPAKVVAREGYYGGGASGKEKRRKSYLPYRRDLVGLFAPRTMCRIFFPLFS